MIDWTPERLMNAYRAELARLYGKDVAEKTVLHYHRGWFYLSVAQVFHDGSIGTVGVARAYRKTALAEMYETLKSRPAVQGRVR